MPIGDLYQDEISKNMLCLKMGLKYNTVFTDGKKMLLRSGAGKMRILFFFFFLERQAKMVSVPTVPSFLFVFPLLVLF